MGSGLNILNGTLWNGKGVLPIIILGQQLYIRTESGKSGYVVTLAWLRLDESKCHNLKISRRVNSWNFQI